jgi:hypothetical protein
MEPRVEVNKWFFPQAIARISKKLQPSQVPAMIIAALA